MIDDIIIISKTLLSCKFSLPYDKKVHSLQPSAQSTDFFAHVHYPLKFKMPDVNWLFLNAPHNWNLKYAIYF